MHLLITAGPTHEPIDDVRYLGNRSSGQLGMAIALASCQRAWKTTLLLGPSAHQPPTHGLLEVHRFETTQELSDLLDQHWPSCQVLLMAAAVSDYRLPPGSRPAKTPRQDQGLDLHLESTPDLVAGLPRQNNQRIIGFALEEEAELKRRALEKLSKKKLDAIVANPLATMNAPDINAEVFFADGSHRSTEKQAKTDFAHWLLEEVADWLESSAAAGGDK